jgi:hypothetical protein
MPPVEFFVEITKFVILVVMIGCFIIEYDYQKGIGK